MLYPFNIYSTFINEILVAKKKLKARVRTLPVDWLTFFQFLLKIPSRQCLFILIDHAKLYQVYLLSKHVCVSSCKQTNR